MTDILNEKNIKYVFFEKFSNPAFAQSFLQDTGAQPLMLDPVPTLSDEDLNNGENFIKIMGDNLEALKKGLECNG